MSTKTEDTTVGLEELRYNPRNYGKSFKQWQIFVAKSREGESIAYRTKEGDICSPEYVRQLIKSEQQKLLDRVEREAVDIPPNGSKVIYVEAIKTIRDELKGKAN